MLFLGPRGWIPTAAGIGADGSERFSLQSPSDITQKMNVTDDGGCAGCSISDIATYFPNQRQWAVQKGFPQNTLPDFQSESLLDANTIAYSIRSFDQGYKTNGVAYMQSTGNVFFGREEITMLSSDLHLESTILNFYTAYTVNG